MLGHQLPIQALEYSPQPSALGYARGPEWPIMPQRPCQIVYIVLRYGSLCYDCTGTKSILHNQNCVKYCALILNLCTVQQKAVHDVDTLNNPKIPSRLAGRPDYC